MILGGRCGGSEIPVEVNELLLSSCFWICFSTVTSNLGRMARTMPQKRGCRRFTEKELSWVSPCPQHCECHSQPQLALWDSETAGTVHIIAAWICCLSLPSLLFVGLCFAEAPLAVGCGSVLLASTGPRVFERHVPICTRTLSYSHWANSEGNCCPFAQRSCFQGSDNTQSLLPPIRGIILKESEANFKMNENSSSSPFLVGSLWDVCLLVVCVDFCLAVPLFPYVSILTTNVSIF